MMETSLLLGIIGIIGVGFGITGFTRLLIFDKIPTPASVKIWEDEYKKKHPDKVAEITNDRIPYVLPKTIETFENDGSVSKAFYNHHYGSRRSAIIFVITGLALQLFPILGSIITQIK